MAQRSDRSTGSSSTGGRKRSNLAPVKKPFPWGTVAVSAVLGALLIGILVYAVTNQGAGFVDPLKAADKNVSGVKVFKDQARTHTTEPVTYDQKPPPGGAHNPTPQACQVYAAPIADEHAVHSLEHGAVWVTYRPDLGAADVKELTALVQGDPYRLLSPYPGLSAPISLQAWGRQVQVDKASDPAVKQFLDAYTNGPQAPERGAACQGTSEPGPLQPPPPAPAATNAPAASPSASG